MTSNSKRRRSGSFLESHSPLKRSCTELNEDDSGEIGELFQYLSLSVVCVLLIHSLFKLIYFPMKYC